MTSGIGLKLRTNRDNLMNRCWAKTQKYMPVSNGLAKLFRGPEEVNQNLIASGDGVKTKVVSVREKSNSYKR